MQVANFVSLSASIMIVSKVQDKRYEIIYNKRLKLDLTVL